MFIVKNDDQWYISILSDKNELFQTKLNIVKRYQLTFCSKTNDNSYYKVWYSTYGIKNFYDCVKSLLEIEKFKVPLELIMEIENETSNS